MTTHLKKIKPHPNIKSTILFHSQKKAENECIGNKLEHYFSYIVTFFQEKNTTVFVSQTGALTYYSYYCEN